MFSCSSDVRLRQFRPSFEIYSNSHGIDSVLLCSKDDADFYLAQKRRDTLVGQDNHGLGNRGMGQDGVDTFV